MPETPRSILRVRENPHYRPERKGEAIVEVLRGGEVVATIYGSREGIHIISDRLGDDRDNTPFYFYPEGVPAPGYVLPLLDEGEVCLWCGGTKVTELGGVDLLCPVCQRDVTRF